MAVFPGKACMAAQTIDLALDIEVLMGVLLQAYAKTASFTLNIVFVAIFLKAPLKMA
jgi:hypothetical protein